MVISNNKKAYRSIIKNNAIILGIIFIKYRNQCHSCYECKNKIIKHKLMFNEFYFFFKDYRCFETIFCSIDLDSVLLIIFFNVI